MILHIKCCLVLNCLMSYLRLNNNIVSCFNYLCHVTLYLIFRIFIYHIFTHHVIFLILFIIAFFYYYRIFISMFLFIMSLLLSYRIFIVMLSLSSWYIFIIIIIIISVCFFRPKMEAQVAGPTACLLPACGPPRFGLGLLLFLPYSRDKGLWPLLSFSRVDRRPKPAGPLPSRARASTPCLACFFFLPARPNTQLPWPTVSFSARVKRQASQGFPAFLFGRATKPTGKACFPSFSVAQCTPRLAPGLASALFFSLARRGLRSS